MKPDWTYNYHARRAVILSDAPPLEIIASPEYMAHLLSHTTLEDIISHATRHHLSKLRPEHLIHFFSED